jgi:hypothetical protein
MLFNDVHLHTSQGLHFSTDNVINLSIYKPSIHKFRARFDCHAEKTHLKAYFFRIGESLQYTRLLDPKNSRRISSLNRGVNQFARFLLINISALFTRTCTKVISTIVKCKWHIPAMRIRDPPRPHRDVLIDVHFFYRRLCHVTWFTYCRRALGEVEPE